MKKRLFVFSFFLASPILFSSCGNTGSKKQENTVIETPKQSLWTDSLKNEFITNNAKTEFEKFALTELVSENEFEKDPAKLKEFILSKDYEDFKSSKSKNFTVVIDNLAGKSKKEIEKILGKPNSETQVAPSGTPCPCDKNNYIYDLIEIVFINGKADWITVNNRSKYILIYKPEKYQYANWFDDYAYVKVFTK